MIRPSDMINFPPEGNSYRVRKCWVRPSCWVRRVGYGRVRYPGKKVTLICWNNGATDRVSNFLIIACCAVLYSGYIFLITCAIQ